MKERAANRRAWRLIGLGLGILVADLGQASINDNFTNATPLHGASAVFSGDLSDATFEDGEKPCSCFNCFGSVGSLWWSWTATNATTVLIKPLQFAGSYSGFGVHQGTNLSTLVDLDCNLLDWRTNRYACFTAEPGTTYFVRVLGYGGSFTLNLTATSTPAILAAPQDQTVRESGSAFFNVVAAGLPPLRYQWLYEGAPLNGKTNAALEMHYVSSSRAGGYSVSVSNVTGVITSAVAHLTVSPTNGPLVLTPMPSGVANRFQFSITGEAGDKYRVMTSGNLVNWFDEESLRPEWDPYWGKAIVQNTNPTSIYSVPMVSTQRFIRVERYMDAEVCIANLKNIWSAVNLWTIEGKREGISAVTGVDLFPYFAGENMVCPAGGVTFGDSYVVTDASSQPTCIKQGMIHRLPR